MTCVYKRSTKALTKIINVRVETAMITKSSKADDKTAAYEFIAYGTAIKYVRS